MTKPSKTPKPSKKARASKAPETPETPKVSVYDVITARVIELLSAGVCPWRKPWTNRFPVNGKTGRRYHGMNLLLLGVTAYSDPRWLTLKQANDMGGHVKADEKCHPVVYWNFREVENAKTGEKETIPILKYFRVFNAEQCEGLTLPALDTDECEPLEGAQSIVDGFLASQKGLALVHGGNRASYSPKHDTIEMPSRGQFTSIEGYYSTLMHEMGHSTGHASRLGRFQADQVAAHGNEETYAKEELVAEMTAAFLANECGLAHELESTVAYLQGWISVLKGDSRLLVQAAGKARKACDMILGITRADVGTSKTAETPVAPEAGAAA